MFATPGTIGKAVEVYAPGILECPLATTAALPAVRPVNRHAGQNAHFASVLAMGAAYRPIIDLVAALFALAQR